MPDISMCRGRGCPSRETCHRFTATPSTYTDKEGVEHVHQAYAPYDEHIPEGATNCQSYWPTPRQESLL